MPLDLIIIRGAPGAGKTSVSERLAQMLGTGVRIEIDAVRSMVTNLSWADTATYCNAITAATTLVFQYLGLGYRPVILVDTLSGGTLTQVTERLAPVTYGVFSLIASDAVLKERILRRNEGFMDYELSFVTNRFMSEDAPPHNCILDTSGSTIEEVCEQIRSRI